MNTRADLFIVPADYKGFPWWIYLQQIRYVPYSPTEIWLSEHVPEPEISD